MIKNMNILLKKPSKGPSRNKLCKTLQNSVVNRGLLDSYSVLKDSRPMFSGLVLNKFKK